MARRDEDGALGRAVGTTAVYHGAASTQNGNATRPARNLRAAVVDPLLDHPDAIAAAVRLVPLDAKRVGVGKARLGYWQDNRPKGRWRISSHNVRQLERLIKHRYGGPCDCDDGEVYFIMAANSMVLGLIAGNAGRGDPIELAKARMRRWANEWVPLVPAASVDTIMAKAVDSPRWWRADSAARLLRLTMAERMACNITTFGAIDCDKEQRAELAKDRKKKRQQAQTEEKRRAAGVKPREEFVAGTVAELARTHGVSRQTIYAWFKSGKLVREAATTTPDTSVARHKKNKSLIHVERHTCQVVALAQFSEEQVADRGRQEAAGRSLAKRLGTVERRAAG